MNMEKTKKNKTTESKILSRMVTLLLIFAIALCLFVTVQVLSRGYASFAGFSLFRVATGSMEPEIPAKSLIVTKYEDIENIQVRDVVCFRAQSPSMMGKTITHRVISKDTIDGKICLQTQGDANPTADAYYVTQDNLVGKVIWCSGEDNFFADFVAFFTNKIGFLALVAFPCLLIAGIILRDCVGNIKGDLKKVLEEMAQEDNDKKDPRENGESEQSTEQEEPSEQTVSPASHMTDEEYEKMRERIRAELIEELKQDDDREKQKTE